MCFFLTITKLCTETRVLFNLLFILSAEEDRHEYGVGFLVHKDIVDVVLGCRPVSSRLISIHLRAAPFSITIIQVYAPTSGHDDSEADHFYQQLQETIDQTPKKDILVLQGDWNAKVEKIGRLGRGLWTLLQCQDK